MCSSKPSYEYETDMHVARLELQLAEAERKLKNSEQELDQLLYHLSHDLRAPLRGIDGYSQALLEDYSAQLEPMARAYLEYIRDSSKQLSQLIDGLLRLSRIERTPIEIVTVDLSRIAREIMDRLQTSLPSQKIEFDLQEGMTIQADSELTSLLMQCLLENAIKFSSRKPEIRIEFRDMIMEGKTVFLLRDHGSGFSMSDASHLFIPFQKIHSQADFPGLGLGLAIAKRIVSRHSGQIWAEGEPDKGATFYFLM